MYQKIHLMLFADDLVLLVESRSGLQSSIDLLVNFNKKWRLSVNVDKTKVMVF